MSKPVGLFFCVFFFILIATKRPGCFLIWFFFPTEAPRYNTIVTTTAVCAGPPIINQKPTVTRPDTLNYCHNNIVMVAPVRSILSAAVGRAPEFHPDRRSAGNSAPSTAAAVVFFFLLLFFTAHDSINTITNEYEKKKIVRCKLTASYSF